MSWTVQCSSSSLCGLLLIFALQPMTLTDWASDRSILFAVFREDNQDYPMAHWQCMYGNCHLSQPACAQCYKSTHSTYGTCAKTYTYQHCRCSIWARWHWYLMDAIDLHLRATTLQLHQTALGCIERNHED